MNNTFRCDPTRESRLSFGLGYNIAKSLFSLETHTPPPPQYIVPDSNDSGNGAMMRLAPMPIFFACHGESAATDAAAFSAGLTHPGLLAAETARFLALVVYRAINRASEYASARALLEAVADEYTGVLDRRLHCCTCGEEADTLRALRALLASSCPEGTEHCWNWRDEHTHILSTLAARGDEYNGHPVSRAYFGSYCMDGLALALYAVATTSSFDMAVERAVNFLGDADTIGAIAGQMAGAYYGAGAIDKRYKDALRPWERDEIAARAVLCFLSGRAARR